MDSNIQPSSATLSSTVSPQNGEQANIISRTVGWYHFILGPLSLIVAVLSFLRSGDTFIEPLPYILFAILNLVLQRLRMANVSMCRLF